MGFPRGTTPTIICTLDEDVLGEANEVYVTLKQKNVKKTFSGDDLDIDGQTVSVYLTQEESLDFRNGEAEIQINWTYSDGRRGATYIEVIQISRNLEPEVLQ